jgi:hypothetical protein
MKSIMNSVLQRTFNKAGRGLLIAIFSIGLAFSASAQRGHIAGHIGGYYGGGHYYAPAYVGVGFGYGYPFFPYYGLYGPWYAYPPYYYGYGAMPSRLAAQVQTIKDDYSQQIKAAKQDKAMTHKQRRERVRELKSERDATIIQARKDYFFNSQRGSGKQPPTYNGNGNQPQNNGKLPSNGGNSQNNSNEQPEYSDKGQQQ